jgi:DNA-binding CsgD family transcriptional regulator
MRPSPAGMLSACGFGFYWSWILITFNSAVPANGNAELSTSLVNLSVGFYLALVLLRVFAIVAWRKLDPLLTNPTALIAVSTLLAAGSLAIVVFCHLSPEPTAWFLAIIGVALCAFGSLWITTVWVNDLKNYEPYVVFFLTTGAFLMAGLLSAVAIIAPPIVAIVCMIIFPIFSGILLSRWPVGRFEQSVKDADKAALAKLLSTEELKAKKLNRRIVASCAGILLVGLSGTMVIAFRDEAHIIGATNLFDLLNTLGITFFSLALFVIIAFRTASKLPRSLPSVAFCRVILVAIALALALPAVFSKLPFSFANMLLAGGMGGFEILLVFYSVEFSRFFKSSAFVTLGVTFGLMELVRAFGQPLSYAIVNAINSQIAQWSTIALVIVVTLMLVALLLILPSMDFFDKAFSQSLVRDSENRVTAIDRLAKTYGFTPREHDVALLLYKGRSLPWIQKDLSISLSTAQTHTKHIYEKLGVHNRQEFLDEVENEAQEPHIA